MESVATPELGPSSVLVVEDDPDISRLIALHLEDLGCRVRAVGDGISALEEALSRRFDLVVLDLMLPRLDGLELCSRLRRRERYLPILMLTARSTTDDSVAGLEAGADDYLTKPFDVRELRARVKAILRRTRALARGAEDAPLEAFRAGPLEIDPDRRRALLDGRELSLTVKEFDLLVQFARHPGRVYTRAQLLDLVWGYGHETYQHTVNSHINRLRAKLEEDPAQPRLILTVWGLGYRFADP